MQMCYANLKELDRCVNLCVLLSYHTHNMDVVVGTNRRRAKGQSPAMKRKEVRKNKRRGSHRSTTRRFAQPRTLEEFFAMPERDQDFWGNVGQVVTEVRAGASLRQASHKFDLDPRRVSQAGRPALRKLRNGRWVARSNDHLLRVLVIPTRKGLREIGVSDFRQASLLGQYWTAVERYRDTGDASALREFRGKYIIDANGKRFRL